MNCKAWPLWYTCDGGHRWEATVDDGPVEEVTVLGRTTYSWGGVIDHASTFCPECGTQGEWSGE